MLCRLFALVSGLLILCGAAQAATYQIDRFINSSRGGFTSTLFHGADGCNAMCGDIHDRARGGRNNGSGHWNSETGEIEFAMSLRGGGSVQAAGLLNFDAPVQPGIIGSIRMQISGSRHGLDGVYDFLFQDMLHVASQGVNGFSNGIIALWGAAGGTPLASGGFSGASLGVDLRIAVSAVPLPASLLLMLSALGGLGVVAYRRRDA